MKRHFENLWSKLMVLSMPSLEKTILSSGNGRIAKEIRAYSETLEMRRHGTIIMCLQRDAPSLAYVRRLVRLVLNLIVSFFMLSRARWGWDAWLSGSCTKYPICVRAPSDRVMLMQ